MMHRRFSWTAIALVFSAIWIVCLVACLVPHERGNAIPRKTTITFDRQAVVIIDPDTGVQYISRGAGSLTPRLNPDGTLFVEKGEKND